jgi:hypothetical protein
MLGGSHRTASERLCRIHQKMRPFFGLDPIVIQSPQEHVSGYERAEGQQQPEPRG